LLIEPTSEVVHHPDNENNVFSIVLLIPDDDVPLGEISEIGNGLGDIERMADATNHDRIGDALH